MLQNFHPKNAGRLCDWESHHDEHGQHCSTIPQEIAVVGFHLAFTQPIITCPPSARTNTKLSMAYSTHTWTERGFFNKWSAQFVTVPGKKPGCLAYGGPRRLLAQLQLLPTSQSSAGRAFARTWAITRQHNKPLWLGVRLLKLMGRKSLKLMKKSPFLSWLSRSRTNPKTFHAKITCVHGHWYSQHFCTIFCPATFDIHQHCCKARP